MYIWGAYATHPRHQNSRQTPEPLFPEPVFPQIGEIGAPSQHFADMPLPCFLSAGGQIDGPSQEAHAESTTCTPYDPEGSAPSQPSPWQSEGFENQQIWEPDCFEVGQPLGSVGKKLMSQPSEAVPCKMLLINKLPRAANEEDVLEVFQQFGSVTLVRLQREACGNSKCFGFVHFRHVEEASQALLHCQRGHVIMDDNNGKAWHIKAEYTRSKPRKVRKPDRSRDQKRQLSM